jgi:hypothetical protein
MYKNTSVVSEFCKAPESVNKQHFVGLSRFSRDQAGSERNLPYLETLHHYPSALPHQRYGKRTSEPPPVNSDGRGGVEITMELESND